MWFSDRPRPQQRLANDLGQLFLIVPKPNYHNFCLAFWVVMAREWVGIDHHRLDKFLLLVRRVLFNQLKRIKESDYDRDLVAAYLSALKASPLSGDKKVPTGIPYHLVDIYVDEVEKVMFEDIEEDEDDEEAEEKQKIVDSTPLTELIEPFVILSKEAMLKTLREKIKEDVLHDERIQTWGAVVKEEVEENDEDDEDQEEGHEEDDSEDEWRGFD